jgi:hypothetical protein
MVTVAGAGPEADGPVLDGDTDADGATEGIDDGPSEVDTLGVRVGSTRVGVGFGNEVGGGEPGATTIATMKPVRTRTTAKPNATRRH